MKYFAKHFCSVCLILVITIATAIGVESDSDADYYSDEGRLLFKVRFFGVVSNAKQTGLPKALVAIPKSANPFIKNGYGGDTATSIFFTDRLAAELSLGLAALNIKYSTLGNVAHNYAGTNTSSTKRAVYMIPLTFTTQYHLAPFGAIRPYVGAGYSGSYLFTKAKEFKIKNGQGLVLQIGTDFVAKDDTVINIDVRKYWLKAKVSYKGALVRNSTTISSTAKINPLLLSIGVGFKL